MIISQEELNQRYWIEENGISFQYYPMEAKIVCETDASLLKAIHLVGMCNIEIDWTSFKGRSFHIQYKSSDKWMDFQKSLSVLAHRMKSKDKVEKESLLKNNIDNNTGKPIKYGTLIKAIFDLGKKYEDKKIRREDIARFFNRYNIEDDVERIARKGSILVMQKSKPASTAIREGKEALIRLFRKGKLVKLTTDEYIAKMERYGKEP